MKTVLCIDDDPISLSIHEIIIKQTKFCEHTVTMINGQDALDYYENLKTTSGDTSPEIIFLDLNMPVLDGWGFLERFDSLYFSHFPKTEIYILSSSVDPSDKLRSEAFPFVKDFISKPITKEILNKIRLSNKESN